MIQHDFSLQELNTFGFQVKAKAYASFKTVAELEAILAQNSLSVLVLGGGSNLVFQEDYPGLILQSHNTDCQCTHETEDELVLEVGAGMVWDDFVAYCVERNYYGVENLTAIPGSVGASPIQNIGAYGVEVKDLVDSVLYYDLIEKRSIRLSNQACNFGYRDSLFKQKLKGRAVVLSVSFRLQKKGQIQLNYKELQEYPFSTQPPSLKEMREAVAIIRTRKLPDWKEVGNVGSFFKNPVISLDRAKNLCKKHPHFRYFEQAGKAKLSAAMLIEEAGFKGTVHQEVGVSAQHALILVNLKGGNGKQIRALADKIIVEVQARFGIQLEPEANFV